MTESDKAPESNGVAKTDLDSKITEQIEYYFGDINLARDKFLQEEIKKDEGWVELATMLKFARLAKLTSDPKVIVDALKKSTNDLVVVSEDNLKIRRNPDKPLPTYDGDYVKDLIAQSLYLKYIPLDATLDDVKEFFNKHTSEGSKVQNIIMRNYLNKLTKEKGFKGSVFATFNSKEAAEKFLNEYKDKELKFNDKSEHALIIKWQQEYNEEKKQEMRSKNKNKGNDKGGAENVEGEEDEEETDKKSKSVFSLPNGALLKVTNIKEPITREDLREYVEKINPEEIIHFIDFEVGDEVAYIRFKEENGAQRIADKMENKEVELKDVKVTFELLTGDDEKAILDRMKVEMFRRRQKLQSEKKGKKRQFGKRKGYQGPNKRQRKD